MAREKGNLLSCVGKTLHHLHESNIDMFFVYEQNVKAQVYRLNLIREEVETAEKQIKKIKNLATEKGYQDILDIFNEQVEFGHS